MLSREQYVDAPWFSLLPHNVPYDRVSSFPPAGMVGDLAMSHLSHYTTAEHILIIRLAEELSNAREALAAAKYARVGTPTVSPPPPAPASEPLLGVPVSSLPPGQRGTVAGHRREPPAVFIPRGRVIVLATPPPTILGCTTLSPHPAPERELSSQYRRIALIPDVDIVAIDNSESETYPD